MSKQRKSRVKINKKYKNIGRIPNSALSKISNYIELPSRVQTIRASIGNTRPAPSDVGVGKLADARDALLVLGYSRAEIMNAFKSVDPSAPTEKIIKDALAALMKR